MLRWCPVSAVWRHLFCSLCFLLKRDYDSCYMIQCDPPDPFCVVSPHLLLSGTEKELHLVWCPWIFDLNSLNQEPGTVSYPQLYSKSEPLQLLTTSDALLLFAVCQSRSGYSVSPSYWRHMTVQMVISQCCNKPTLLYMCVAALS